MFDNTTAVAENLQPEERAAVWQSDAFANCDGVPDKYGRLQVKNYKGWTVTFYPATSKLRVQGSLPTFANGNNLQLLTYPEMQLTIPALAAAVGLPVTRLQVVGLELSLDFESSTSPQSFLETLQHHKHSKFCIVLPRNSAARPLEYVAVHADFNAKLYDKNKWAKQLGLPVLAGQHKLRYEIVMKRARPINALLNRSVITLADLLSPEFYAAAAAELEQRWREIVRSKPLDYTGLSRKDRDLLATRGSKDHWRGLKAVVAPITVKRHKRRYAELVEAMAKRIGPDEYDQRFPLALAALLPPVATAQIDTFLHTSSLLELPSMRVVKEAAPPLVNDAGAGGLPASSPCLPDDDETAPTARRCLTCGRVLASSSSRAKFCSERERGAAAKKCRNAASNPTHNTRRAVNRILSLSTLFDQRPFLRIPEPIRAAVLAAAA
jgi:hypothetical protein